MALYCCTGLHVKSPHAKYYNTRPFGFERWTPDTGLKLVVLVLMFNKKKLLKTLLYNLCKTLEPWG